jgi:hypothetical protein
LCSAIQGSYWVWILAQSNTPSDPATLFFDLSSDTLFFLPIQRHFFLDLSSDTYYGSEWVFHYVFHTPPVRNKC